MPIITLTTDFGYTDYYAALLKGAILTQEPQATLVDITHNIPQHDIVQGAFILKNAYSAFPKKTIHILSVNNFYTKNNSFLVLEKEDYFFIGPDNGIFSLLFDQQPEHIYRLPNESGGTFPMAAIFAQAVSHLAKGKLLSELGQPLTQLEQRLTLQPVIAPSQIRGSVIHVDHYENVIVNIRKTLFDTVGHGRPFSLFFKRHDPIQELCTSYNDVPIGEQLCLFNAAGYLEIAINMGKAASLFSLGIDDTIQIDFHN